jgi:hypothetical protein
MVLMCFAPKRLANLQEFVKGDEEITGSQHPAAYCFRLTTIRLHIDYINTIWMFCA